MFRRCTFFKNRPKLKDMKKLEIHFLTINTGELNYLPEAVGYLKIFYRKAVDTGIWKIPANTTRLFINSAEKVNVEGDRIQEDSLLKLSNFAESSVRTLTMSSMESFRLKNVIILGSLPLTLKWMSISNRGSSDIIKNSSWIIGVDKVKSFDNEICFKFITEIWFQEYSKKPFMLPKKSNVRVVEQNRI